MYTLPTLEVALRSKTGGSSEFCTCGCDMGPFPCDHGTCEPDSICRTGKRGDFLQCNHTECRDVHPPLCRDLHAESRACCKHGSRYETVCRLHPALISAIKRGEPALRGLRVEEIPQRLDFQVSTSSKKDKEVMHGFLPKYWVDAETSARLVQWIRFRTSYPTNGSCGE